MTLNEILNIIALVSFPIVAVIIAQHLQNRSKNRDAKMDIFKALMTARIYGWTESSVHALNLIDIVFCKSPSVRKAWEEYRNSLNVTEINDTNKKSIMNKKWKLLETISNDLGYKGKVTWETIQNPYIPEGLYNMWEEQSEARKTQTQMQKQYSDFMIAATKSFPMQNDSSTIVENPENSAIVAKEESYVAKDNLPI